MKRRGWTGLGWAGSIRWQLTAATLVTVLAVLGVGFGLLAARDIRELTAEAAADTVVMARMIGESSAGDLAFGAQDESTRMLARLVADTRVKSVALYDAQGHLFSSYAPAGGVDAPAQLSPPMPDAATVIGPREIAVLHDVGFKGERFGTVRVVSDTAPIEAQARAHRLAFLGMGALLIVIAMGISGLLQHAVSVPVLELAALAERISVRRDWAERAPLGGSLELDALARGFNTLLAAIGQREAERDAAERAQRRYLERLAVLRDVDRAILAATSPAEVAERVAAHITAMTRCSWVEVRQHDGQSAAPTVLARAPPPVRGEAAVASDENAGAETEEQVEIPLRAGEGDLGCLLCGAPVGTALNTEERELAQELADLVTVSIRQETLAAEVAQHTVDLERRVEDRTRQLTETVRELEAFGYTVAHDLRAPLRALHGYATLVLEECGATLPAPMGEYLHRIVGAAQRMDRLIVDLLEYSRLGRGTLELAPVSLDEVVREACALLGPTLEARRARVTVQRPLATVTGNRIALVQVVTNLFDNATKFSRTDQPPVVRVWTEPTPSGARLCVEDNGIGMDPSYLGGIFQVFHRLHASEAFPGTGIGLAIVRRATERMGGTVGVSSQTGQGSRFWVDMPVPDGQERHR